MLDLLAPTNVITARTPVMMRARRNRPQTLEPVCHALIILRGAACGRMIG
jgi:hypothetical protein